MISAQQRLRWWLVFCLSVVLTGVSGWYYGSALMETDSTYISIGIVAIYFVISVWAGIALHTVGRLPEEWMHYAIGLLPSLGLIGALLGMVQLFGLNLSGADISDSSTVLRGLGLVLFASLAGLIYSELIVLQLRVCGRD